MEWSSETIMQFLDLYQSESVIWDPRNELHKDRNRVYEAWRRIQRNLGMKCSLCELKTKKNNLMATYRKLMMKVRKSQLTGGAVYEPEWFAFDKMASFLHDVYTPRANRDENLEAEAADAGGESAQIETNIPKLEVTEDSSSSIADLTDESPAVAVFEHEEFDSTGSAPLIPVGPPTGKKRKAEKMPPVEAYHSLKQAAPKPKVGKDDCDLFCELLCLKLRGLDEDTREIAMHEINNLMFNLKRSKSSQVAASPQCSLQQSYYYRSDLQETMPGNPCQSPLYGSPGASSASQPSPVLITTSPSTLVYQDHGPSHSSGDPLEIPEKRSPC